MYINKYLHIIVAALLLCFSLSSISQNNSNLYRADKRLYQILDKSYIEQLESQQSELIVYYNYYLDHAYYIIDLKQEKPITGENINTIKVRPEFSNSTEVIFSEKNFNKDTFNPLYYDFKEDFNNFKTYIWEEAGIALVFYPTKQFQSSFKEYKKKSSIK